MDDNREPSAKRRKRTIFRACDNCVHAKTRCEDVDPSGCSLCRRRKKDCSLAGNVDDDVDEHRHVPRTVNGDGAVPGLGRGAQWDSRGHHQHMQANDGPQMDDVRVDDRLHHLEQAVQDLQSELLAQPRTGTARSSISSHRGVHQQLHGQWDAASISVPFVDIPKQPGLPYGDTLYTIRQIDSPFPSVVRRGILSADQVDMAWHTFKHAIVSTCPLSVWQSVSTPTPTHPFVVLAMLHYVPSFASHPELVGMVEESLLLVVRAQVDEDVVMALLILALAPPMAGQEAEHSIQPKPTPLRLITMAYDVGKALRLPTSVRVTIREAPNLGRVDWREALQQVEMWTAVVDRYNLLRNLVDTPESLIVTPVYTLDDYADPSHQLFQSHHQQLESLNRTAFAALVALMTIEEDPQNKLQAEKQMLVYQANFTALGAAQYTGPTRASLQADNLCCQQTLCVRIITFLIRLPTPLIQPREVCQGGMQRIRQTCSAVMLHLVPDIANPPTRLVYPAYVAQSGLAACLMLLAAVWFVKTARPAMPVVGIDPPRLNALVKLLCDSDPIMRIIIQRTESVFGRADAVAAVAANLQSLGRDAEARVAMDAQGMMGNYAGGHTVDLGNLPLDPAAAQLFDLDLVGWDFLMTDWTADMGA